MSYNPIGSSTNLTSPYGNQRYNESTGYITPAVRKRTSKWIKFGLPVALIIIVGAVVAIIFGIRAKHSNTAASAAASASSAAAAVSAANEIGIFATATNSEFMVPLYPSTVRAQHHILSQYSLFSKTNNAAFTIPTFIPSSNSSLSWPADPFQPSSPSVTTVRPDRPRLIAPTYKWNALPALIQNYPYLQAWNDTIFGNATAYYSLPPVVYFMDNSSGILDNARAVKERVKAFSYVYRMTNDTKWVDRCWLELQVRVFRPVLH